ncbi:MAG: hypothetical protein NZM38_10200 [Cytophagales bacterium]|nr:hypothetical protein [Cytophagales bacterium]MDW8385125.1 hypothetical protein [Flammeovirgaceae bacterium]
MLVPIENLPPNSRIWIYQSNRELSETEVAYIKQELRNFLQTWQAHNKPLESSFQVLHNRFILIAVNQEKYAPSGCAIDKCVNLIQQFEKQLNVCLTDRTQVNYWKDNQIMCVNLRDLKETFSNGILQPTTLVFDITLQTLSEFEKSFQNQAQNTWLKKYLSNSPQ